MIIILFGVTGVGKTTIGKLLAGDLGWTFYDADDYHPPANIAKMKAGIPLTDADRSGWLLKLRELLEGVAAAGESCVLACSALKPAYRDELRVNDDVRFVLLRADEATLQARLAARKGHFMNPHLLKSQLETLDVSSGQMFVIDATKTPDEIVMSIEHDVTSADDENP